MIRPLRRAVLWTGIAWVGAAEVTGAVTRIQMDFDEPISLSLKEAPGKEVLAAFARILGARLDLDPAVRGKFTAEFARVPVANALDTVCETLGCRAHLVAGDPPVLRVEQLISMSLRDADVDDVLASLARIRDLTLDLAPDVSGSITVELRRVTWEEGVTAVCEAAGCRIALEESTDGRRMVATRVEGDATGEAVRTGRAGLGESETVDRASPSVTLLVHFFPPGSDEPLAGKIALGWKGPIFSLRAPGGVGSEMRLAWLPLGAGAGVLLPFLVECGDGDETARAHVFEPLALPLAKAVSVQAAGARLDLIPISSPTPAPEPRREGAALLPDPLDASCLKPSRVALGSRLRLGAGGEQTARTMLSGGVGTYVDLLVPDTEVAAATEAELALVLLGRDPSGNVELGLLSRDAGGAPLLELGEVMPDLAWSSILTLGDGSLLEIEVEVLEP